MSTGLLRRLETEIGSLVERHDTTRDLSAFDRYRDDPCGFASDVLKVKLWSRQEELAEAIRDHPLVRCQSGNSIGKDFVVAGVLAAWWIYACRGFVLMTGTSDRQVREVCMKELRRAFHRGNLPGELYTHALRVPGSEDVGLLAFVSNEASRMTGFHFPRTLTIITESQGADDWALEAMLANLAGAEDRLAAVGNPTSPSGWFYQTSKAPDWHSLTISAFEHPNVVQGRTVIPGAVTAAQIERIRSTYGESSPVYLARVLGEYPEQSLTGLYELSHIEAAMSRHAEFLEKHAESPAVVSVDPARFGADHTAVAVRRGPCVVEVRTWAKQSLTETSRRVLALLDELGVAPGQRGVVVCDVVGLGSGVVDMLRDARYTVRAFNAGAKAKDPERFVNARSEVAWLLRDELEAGSIALPDDPDLHEEMLAVEWGITTEGRIALEPKDAMKSRLGRSPDRLDAVLQTAGTKPPDLAGLGVALRRIRGLPSRRTPPATGGYTPGGWMNLDSRW